MHIRLTEFSDLIERYIADFVGRAWLAAQVDEALADATCRFVVLTGDSGVGKTAFMAHLADTHPDWLHYFIRRDSRELLRPGDATTFLLTIGGQLATLRPALFHPEHLEIVVRQRIGSVEAGGKAIGAYIEELRASPFYVVALNVEQEIRSVAGEATTLHIGRMVSNPRLIEKQDLQYMALLDPARLLAKTEPGTRIVVLIDAIDELRYSPAEPDILRSLLELPADTPSNLKFVLSSRPEAVLNRLLERADVRRITIDPASQGNKDDLRVYFEQLLAADGLGPTLKTMAVDTDNFRQRLLDKASGNFLYLKSVAMGISAALPDPAKHDRLVQLLRIEALPDDLHALYNYFLSSIVEWIKRSGFGKAAWRTYLRPLLGILAVAREPLSPAQLISFTRLAPEDLGDLLQEIRQFVEAVDDQQAFHIYHSSFAEYLLDAESNRNYRIDGVKWHTHIANVYHSGHIDQYGLRWLTYHLFEAKAFATLHTLLASDFLDKKSGHNLLSIVDDLQYGISAAKQSGEDQLPYLFYYQLILAGLRTQVGGLPEGFYRALGRLGYGQQAWSLASFIPHPQRRAFILSEISNELARTALVVLDPKSILAEIETLRSSPYQQGQQAWETNHQIARWIARLSVQDLDMAVGLVSEYIYDPYYQAQALADMARTAGPQPALELLKQAYVCAGHVFGGGGRSTYVACLLMIGRSATQVAPGYALQILNEAWGFAQMEARKWTNFIDVEQWVEIAQATHKVDPAQAQQIIQEIWDLRSSIEQLDENQRLTDAECCRVISLGSWPIRPDISKAALERLSSLVLRLESQQAETGDRDGDGSEKSDEDVPALETEKTHRYRRILETEKTRRYRRILSAVRSELAQALAAHDTRRALNEIERIGFGYNQDHALKTVATYVAKTDIAAAIKLRLQAEAPYLLIQSLARDLAKLVETYLAEPSDKVPHDKAAIVYQVITSQLEGEVKMATLARIIDTLAARLPEHAHTLLPEIMAGTPWIGTQWIRRQPLDELARGYGITRWFEQPYIKKPVRHTEWTDTEVDGDHDIKPDLTPHRRKELERVRNLASTIARMGFSDGAYDDTLWDLRLAKHYRIFDESARKQLLAAFAQQVKRELSNKHRERIIGELAELSLDIVHDREWLLGFLEDLFNMLEDPDRQTEDYQFEAEFKVAAVRSWVHFPDRTHWWLYVCEVLSQSALQGADHLIAVTVAQSQLFQEATGPEIIVKLQEAYDAVGRRLTTLPFVLFA